MGLMQVATDEANRYINQGVPKDQAVRIAVNALHDVVSDAEVNERGLGQISPDEPIIKAVRESISPWLWIFSVVSFGLGLMNTHRIKKMFKTWKKGQRVA